VAEAATPQNIVIGGAAGAFPADDRLGRRDRGVSLEAVLMFGLIFMWTPPHFWALALFMKSDYDEAGVPMLTVTHGRAETRRQIWIYTVLLAPWRWAGLHLDRRAGLPGRAVVLNASSSRAPGDLAARRGMAEADGFACRKAVLPLVAELSFPAFRRAAAEARCACFGSGGLRPCRSRKTHELHTPPLRPQPRRGAVLVGFHRHRLRPDRRQGPRGASMEASTTSRACRSRRSWRSRADGDDADQKVVTAPVSAWSSSWARSPGRRCRFTTGSAGSRAWRHTNVAEEAATTDPRPDHQACASTPPGARHAVGVPPVEREMEMRIGETGLAFYEAYNPTDRPVAGTASYNVAPFEAGRLFSPRSPASASRAGAAARRAGADAGHLLRRPRDRGRPDAKHVPHHAVLHVPRRSTCPKTTGALDRSNRTAAN
jgi:hypothetical protein